MSGEAKKLIKYFLWILLVVCMIESFIGFLQFFNIIAYKGEIIYETVIVGTFGNANSVGGYLAASLPLLFGLLLISKLKFQKVIILFGILISTIIVVLTKSRGAWLAIPAAFIIFNYPFLQKIWKKLKNKVYRIAVVILILIMSMSALYFIFNMNKDSSMGRIFLWKITWMMIKENPITGIGYGNYPAQYLNYQEKFFTDPENSKYYDFAANIKESHNGYLQIFAETGIIGLLIFLTIIFVFYFLCTRILSFKESNDTWQITRAVMASNTIILVHSLFDSPLCDMPVFILFYFNLIIVSVFSKYFSLQSGRLQSNDNNISLRNDETRKSSSNSPSNKKLFRFFLIKESEEGYAFLKNYSLHVNIKKYRTLVSPLYNIIIIAYLIFAVIRIINIFNQVEAYSFWKKGQMYANGHHWNLSIQSYKRALESIPYEGELHFHLAGAYLMNKQFKKALPEFSLALQNFNDKNIYYSRGMAYQQLRNYELAEKNYQTAIDMFPNLLFPKYLLGKMYVESGKIMKAQMILESILYIQPKIYNKDTEAIKHAAEKLLNDIEKNHRSVPKSKEYLNSQQNLDLLFFPRNIQNK